MRGGFSELIRKSPQEAGHLSTSLLCVRPWGRLGGEATGRAPITTLPPLPIHLKAPPSPPPSPLTCRCQH